MSRRRRSRRWVRLRSGGFRWVVDPDAADEIQEKLIGSPKLLGAPIRVHRQRRGRSFYTVQTASGGLFVKRFTLSRYRLEYALKAPLGRLPLRRELRIACRAWSCGVTLPRPLAFAEAHRPLRGYDCLLAYRLAPTLRPLVDVFPSLSPPRRESLTEVLAASVACQHRAGVYHLDLSPLNVMVAPSGSNPTFVDWENSVIGRPDDSSIAQRSLRRQRLKFSGLAGFDQDAFQRAYLLRSCQGASA